MLRWASARYASDVRARQALFARSEAWLSCLTQYVDSSQGLARPLRGLRPRAQRESTALVLGVRQERVAAPVNLLAIRFGLVSDRRG
jgi:hypothetical protein